MTKANVSTGTNRSPASTGGTSIVASIRLLKLYFITGYTSWLDSAAVMNDRAPLQRNVRPLVSTKRTRRSHGTKMARIETATIAEANEWVRAAAILRS